MNNSAKDVTKDVTKELTDRHMVIMKLIEENPFVTVSEMSRKTGIVVRTIKRDIEYLQTKGLLVREGVRKEGHWIMNA